MSKVREWDDRSALALTRRRVKTLKATVDKLLSDIALGWADLDSFNEKEADDLIQAINDQLDRYLKSVDEAVAEKVALSNSPHAQEGTTP